MTSPLVYSHYALRANKYVPAMQYSADFEIGSPVRLDLGTPAASETATIAAAVSIAAAVDVTLTTPVVAGSTYGQSIRLVLSGAGAVAAAVFGYDFWGQPMSEAFTTNGTTAVVGLKAFKTVTRYTCALVGGTTLGIGFMGSAGLPWKTMKILSEDVDDAPGTVGTLTAPVLTDPATTATGDPRGTYAPNSAFNGTKRIVVTAMFSNAKNAAGNGGLMGIRHVTA